MRFGSLRDKEKWNRDIRERDIHGTFGKEHLDEGAGTALGRLAGIDADKENPREPSVCELKQENPTGSLCPHPTCSQSTAR